MKRKNLTASLAATAMAVGIVLVPALSAQASQSIPSSPGHVGSCSPDGQVYITSVSGGSGQVDHFFRHTTSDNWTDARFTNVTAGAQETTYTGLRAAYWQAQATSSFRSAGADCSG